MSPGRKAHTDDPSSYALTPLFQHVHPTNEPTYHRNRNGQYFSRRILDQIVTPIPISTNDSHNEGDVTTPKIDDSGDIEVCIEEITLIHKPPTSAQISSPPLSCHGFPTRGAAAPPLFRRVAVRSYGRNLAKPKSNVKNPFYEDNGDENDGLLHATFSLPICPLPSRNASLCWASFAANTTNQETFTSTFTSTPMKSYLCVLAGPNTLRIFDVFPNQFRVSPAEISHREKNDLSGVGEGHVVSLPFEASSIFALPHGGLLIQREGLPPVPSLYTLHHPLDDIRPCLILPNERTPSTDEHCKKDTGTNSLFYSNPFEAVIYVGNPQKHISIMESEQEEVVVVTFNTMRKNHSIWILQQSRESPIHDLNAQVSLSCIFSTLDRTDNQMSMDEDSYELKSDDSIVTPNDIQARQLFLATGSDKVSEVLLCLVQDNKPADRLEKGARSTSYRMPNPRLLSCFTLRRSKHIGDNDKAACWKVSGLTTISCISAQPIHATSKDLTSFRLGSLLSQNCGRSCHNMQSLMSKGHSSTDIMLCRSIQCDAKLSLMRGCLHVVDCVLKMDSDAEASVGSPWNIVDLKHSVNDRLDLVYEREGSSTLSVRVLASLQMKSSAITQRALSSISSSLRGGIHHPTLHNVSWDQSLERLSYFIVSDCARYSQLLGKDFGAQSSIDDVEWVSFSVVISTFIELASTSTCHSELMSCIEEMSKVGTEQHENKTTGDDEDWTDLLNSDFHLNYSKRIRIGSHEEKKEEPIVAVREDERKRRRKLLFSISSSSLNWLSSNIEESDDTMGGLTHFALKTIFDGLHLLYEDMKMARNSIGNDSIQKLSMLLSDLCTAVGRDESQTLLMGDFINHYFRDYGQSKRADECSLSSKRRRKVRISQFYRPPCFHSMLEGTMKRDSNMNLSKCHDMVLHGECKSMSIISQLFIALFEADYTETLPDQKAGQKRDRYVIKLMVEAGFSNSSEIRERFTSGIALPLIETIERCRSDPPPPFSKTWPTKAYELVGRMDLAKTKSSLERRLIRSGNRVDNHGGEGSMSERDNALIGSIPKDDPDKDGLVSIERFASMRFPNDNRIREACKLLRSSRPIRLHVDQPVEVSHHDFEQMKQDKLSLLCRRTLSLSVGRGMLTIGTENPIPAESLPIPKLSLAGRVPPQNSTLALDVTNCAAGMSMWPEFHNGVAAGLRLPPASSADGMKSTLELARTWIVYNKPFVSQSNSTQSNNNGQNNSTQSTPEPNHAHGGFLLALGLRGHLSALSMIDICEYLTQGPVTTAVGILLGMGADYRGSCDLSVSKMLCLHIPSLLPPSFASIDVASQTQAAAVAGVGLLYQGSSHRLMTEFLLNEIGKSPTNEQNTNDRESYNLCCGIALGMVNLNSGRDSANSSSKNSSGISDLHLEERLHRFIVGGSDDRHNRRHRTDGFERASGGGITGESEKCSKIHEGDVINTDMTSPGATLALGMIYFQSGNESVAQLLALPDTHFLLDYVRPDFLFLRIVARSLILWETIEATESWMNDQIPTVIANSYDHLRKTAEKSTSLSGLANFAAMSMSEMKDERKDDPETEDDKAVFDRQAIRQSHVFCQAGICFALGLKFAGTGDEHASAIIYNRAIEIQKLRDESDPVSLALRPERPVIEMCLGSIAISLAMVMSGTGDLKTFGLLKSLRWKCDENVKYGNHMAYSTAIGLLFLGGGSCVLGNSPEDVAALLLSFFPRFPIHTQDNQYHLQALRHLYAIAVKNRQLDIVDIDTKEKVFVPIEINFNDAKTIQTKAPCLLLNKDKISKICVVSDRYYPVEVDMLSIQKLDSGIKLYVSRKFGHLTYMQEPHAPRSLLVQHTRSMNALKLIQSFTEDPKLLSFAKYFCFTHFNSVDTNQKRLFSLTASDEEFYTHVLRESLSRGKAESIPLYLSLHNTVSSLTAKACPSAVIWDIRLLRAYFEHMAISKSDTLSSTFLTVVCESIDRLYSVERLEISKCERYLQNFEKQHFDRVLFGSFLIWCEVAG